jgi:chorismate-pyruvate lyase
MPAILHPLHALYAAQGIPLPKFERIEGAALPEPHRKLLVHESDMTPTLERFHASRIHIHVLRRERREDFYLREVVLLLDEDETPVEFGANRIHLEHFAPETRWLILQEKVPLGRILKDHGVPHTSRPAAFFRVRSDALINGALHLAEPMILYGRKATISALDGNPLSEVVEILPPSEG